MAFGLGVAKGMLTTISHLVKAPVTIQYPEERLDMPIWTRGRPRLIYEVDTGELRCTACGACALACPVDVIKIEQHPSPIKGKMSSRSSSTPARSKARFWIASTSTWRAASSVHCASRRARSGQSPWRRTSRWRRPTIARSTWCTTCTSCASRARPRSTRAWSTSRASSVA